MEFRATLNFRKVKCPRGRSIGVVVGGGLSSVPSSTRDPAHSQTTLPFNIRSYLYFQPEPEVRKIRVSHRTEAGLIPRFPQFSIWRQFSRVFLSTSKSSFYQYLWQDGSNVFIWDANGRDRMVRK